MPDVAVTVNLDIGEDNDLHPLNKKEAARRMGLALEHLVYGEDGETQVGFRDIDFGAYGSDEIILPIFPLTDDPYELEIYEGMPDEGGRIPGKICIPDAKNLECVSGSSV